MDPRLQAGLELQLEKQAQQEYESSLSGVLGQYFKQAAEPARGGGEGDTGEAERPDTFSSTLGTTLTDKNGPSPSRRAWDYWTGPNAGAEASDIADKNIAQATDWARRGVDQATAKTQSAADWARGASVHSRAMAAAKTQSAVGGALSGILSKYIQGVQGPAALAGVVKDTASAAGSNLKYFKRKQQEALKNPQWGSVSDAAAGLVKDTVSAAGSNLKYILKRRQQEAAAKAQEPYDLADDRALRRRNIARERLENENR